MDSSFTIAVLTLVRFYVEDPGPVKSLCCLEGLIISAGVLPSDLGLLGTSVKLPRHGIAMSPGCFMPAVLP
jgi:hypothetical protein